MADLHRVMRLCLWFLVGFLLSLRIGIAFAEGTVPPQPAYVDSPPVYYTYGQPYSSAAAACAAFDPTLHAVWYGSPGSARCENDSGGWANQMGANCPSGASIVMVDDVYVCRVATGGPTCPANSTDNGAGACTCAAGMEPSQGACVPRSCPSGPGRTTGSSVWLTQSASDLGYYCDAGCKFAVNGTSICLGGACFGASGGNGLGAPCDPATNIDPNAGGTRTTEATCLKEGRGYATINGVVTCAPPSPAAPVTTISRGNTNTSSTDPVTGQPTSTGQGTTTTVTDRGGSVTTTTTTTPAEGGGPAATTTTEKPKETFCAENPKSPLCVESTVSGGGSCSSPPACSGDAATCAIVAQAFATRCEAEKLSKEGAQSELGEAIVAGNDPLAGTLPSAENATSIDMQGRINTASFLSSGCIDDEVIHFSTWDFTIPWSRLCSTLEVMGSVMVALAMLGAARIVGVF